MNDMLKVILDMVEICCDPEADRDEVCMAARTIEEAATVEIDRLQEIVDKLPKTADGVPYAPGDTVYGGNGSYTLSAAVAAQYSRRYYSTKAAAQAAGEEKT